MSRLRVSLCLVFLVAAALIAAGSTPARPEDHSLQKGAIKIRDGRVLSQGARAWFDPPRAGEEDDETGFAPTPSFGSNVDANDPMRDLAAGQSETAIAASGDTVMAAWNDVSGFLVGDPTRRRASVTGVGISHDGAKTFTDLIGLPNNDPNQQWFGDPAVVAVDDEHFIVASFWLPAIQAQDFCAGRLTMAVSVATVRHSGDVQFSNPIPAVNGGSACSQQSFFPDRDWLEYDPVSRTLVMSYTRFAFSPPEHCGNGQIEMVRAHVPAQPSQLRRSDFSDPIVIQPEEGGNCRLRGFVVNQGSFVAVAPGGDAYVSWERNWISNLFNGNPFVYPMVALVPSDATAPTAKVVVTVNQRNARNRGVKSLDGAFIPGYSRGIGHDWPRVAWNEAANALDVVWNDASLHPLGDVFLKELAPDLSDYRTAPIRKLNDDNSYALHFLPSVSVQEDGTICSSWYDRRLNGADSTETDYFGECRASEGAPAMDFRITTSSTDWVGTASLIDPNFGDYTDSDSSGATTYFLWSDGRLGVPQPFADSNA